MKKIALTLLTTLVVGTAFAASHAGAPMPEAMKAGDMKAQDAAQKKVDAKAKAGDKSAMQPEAMKQGNDKAQAAAEMKQSAKTGKKASTDAQMGADAKKL